MPWMVIVVLAVILFNLLADLLYAASTRGSALTERRSTPSESPSTEILATPSSRSGTLPSATETPKA